ncbi:glycoside hydrolase [Staphylotrichum tortipilum]|uniref:alpha-1,2-Mannosidase n=1 Tax=Staphylotrichum tortipilum TaxID=2831512 RepID=A0AAN6MB16_9PEZI|nr:glycoside hydrolase [Staphylotrichum longicolle]
MAFLKIQRLVLAAALSLTAWILLGQTDFVPQQTGWHIRTYKYTPSSFDWANRTQSHPVDEASMTRLPAGDPRPLPPIQHQFTSEELSESHNNTQRERRNAVRRAALRSWRAYRDHAWGRDEVTPQTLVGRDTFAGWGATLVDALDTLWIMGLKQDFRDAVEHVAAIDWDKATSEACSLFETNIRYLGGLLSAYDLSGERVLLDKAVELGDMLHAGFDTPNNMPANGFHFAQAKAGKLVASLNEASAAAGTLSLEFTHLSQLTGDPKYYHAIDGVKRALERTQDSTNLPGMWPVFIDLQSSFFTPGTSFSLGASSDSAYEYLSKMHALLGGLDPAYEKLHTKAMATAAQHLLFRPMLPPSSPPTTDILFSGTVLSNGKIIELIPEVQHLGCFAGGMFALGGRLFHNASHIAIGEQLARGCAWAYTAFPTGVMPELSSIIPCNTTTQCTWNETAYQTATTAHGTPHRPPPPPFTAVLSPGYFLRPEAAESLFVLYRVTGKADLLEAAWGMFQAVEKATRTRRAYSAIADVGVEGETGRVDSMESFWIAETLKYFYLIFSEPELISLDEYVFNTEAHPFRLPKPGVKQ